MNLYAAILFLNQNVCQVLTNPNFVLWKGDIFLFLSWIAFFIEFISQSTVAITPISEVQRLREKLTNIFFKFRRGGVLEPSGTCEIKYKMKDIVRTMKRLDEKYCDISNQIAAPGKLLST